MPTRKRKLGNVQKDVEKPIESVGTQKIAVPKQNSVATVVGQAQSSEAFHTKYIKELQQIYKKVCVTFYEKKTKLNLICLTICSWDMRRSLDCIGKP